MTTLFIMALVAIMMVSMAVRFVRSVAKTIPSVEVGVAVDAGLCHFRNQWDFGPTRTEMKVLRLRFRRARQHAWHIVNCASKEAARKARKEAMSHVSSAQRRAEKVSKANQWMVGKSWQEAIHALYKEGKLVSTRSKGVAIPAVHGAKTARVTTGKSFLAVKAGIKSIAQKDAEYRSTHRVVGSKMSTAPTWSMWQKTVPMGRVLLLVQRREAAVEKANKMAIQALERHLKIAAWEAVQAAKVAA